MRKKKLIAALISLLTVMIMMFAVTFTAFATDEPDTHHPDHFVGEVTEAETTPAPTDPPTEPEVQTDPPTEPPTEAPTEPSEETQDTSKEDKIDDLPQVESQEVVIPTTVDLPEVEVSDTTLLGGVIAWLCVAVGIAVIAGVLVSQRTRQVGSSNQQSSGRR